MHCEDDKEDIKEDSNEKRAVRYRKPRKDYVQSLPRVQEVTLKAIGYIRSPYVERFGCPRQAVVETGVLDGVKKRARIEFVDGCQYDKALEDLEGFSHIWVITLMHLNLETGWSPKVRPPRGDEKKSKRGVFSTRSPHRPNPLALSALAIESIEPQSLTIYVHGIDLLDNTPVLDVKPYIPYTDSFPSASTGWLSLLDKPMDGADDPT